jgi:hypothetical protein
MVDNVVLETPPAKPQATPLDTDKEALFDSIAHETTSEAGESPDSPFQAFFTGLLWFGYAIAIVVALALVWSGAKELLKALPR